MADNETVSLPADKTLSVLITSTSNGGWEERTASLAAQEPTPVLSLFTEGASSDSEAQLRAHPDEPIPGGARGKDCAAEDEDAQPAPESKAACGRPGHGPIRGSRAPNVSHPASSASARKNQVFALAL